MKLCQCNRFMLQTNLSSAFKGQVKHLFPYILLVWFAQKEVSRAFITKAKTQPVNLSLTFPNRMMIII